MSPFKKKFLWSIKLYKDGKQVHEEEILKRISQRPLFNVHVTAEKSWTEGSDLRMTFNRIDIEECDEIWVGLRDVCGNLLEEWELLNVKVILPYTKEYFEANDQFEVMDEDGQKTVHYSYEHYRYKVDGKWNNYSNLKMS